FTIYCIKISSLIRSLVTNYNMSWFKSNFGWMVIKLEAKPMNCQKDSIFYQVRSKVIKLKKSE
ncbi:unnamed protein product, partial [Prunus brigantina]